MNLRDYLEQREREVLDELGPLYIEVKRREAELADIRRAKVSIGMSPPWRAEEGLGRFASVDGLARGLAAPFVDVFPKPTTRMVASNFGAETAATPLQPPYAHLTMKQLIVKALDEHFHHGASARELVDFFRDAWFRNIERTNLSPQISRLYHDDIIGRLKGSKKWYLLPAERRGRKPYHRKARAVHSNAIVPIGPVEWLLPDEVTEDHMLADEPDRAQDLDVDED